MIAPILLAASAWPVQGADDNPGDRLVKVELLADRAAIRPGEAFSLGVRLRIEPTWHVYWENHGDSGMPTRVKIHGPPGFTFEAPRFPGPERHVGEGDIVSYVHFGELVLLVDGKAPEALPPDLARAAFDVEARWLVCTEVCYPGTGQAKVEIPIAHAEAKPAPANEKAFADARARLPKPWSELAGASVEWRGSRKEPVLVLTVPGASDLELFPLSSESLSLIERKVEPDEGACSLTASCSFEPPETGASPRFQGVLRVSREQTGSFYRVDCTR
jgi:DsbC/DsbD-like thiol-disulfide interchange protein